MEQTFSDSNTRITNEQESSFNALNSQLSYTSQKYKRLQTNRKQVNTKVELLNRNQLMWDIAAAFFASASIIIIIWESESFYDNDNTSTFQINLLKSSNLIITGILIILIWKHFWYEFLIQKHRLQIKQTFRFTETDLWKQMIFEWGLIILFCPPFIDYYFSGEMLEGIYTYSIDGIASTFLIIRVFIILKLYKHFSAWLASDAFNHNPKYGKPSILFAIKADFKFQPHFLMFFAICFIVIIGGYITFKVERVQEDGLSPNISTNYITNTCWMTIVTMTTTGYGDAYPVTHTGRMIMIVVSIISLVVVSIFIVALNNFVMFSLEESKAYHAIRRVNTQQKARIKAANVIKQAFLLKRSMVNQNKFTKIGKVTRKLQRNVFKFRKGLDSIEKRYLSSQEMVANLELLLLNLSSSIKAEFINVSYIGKRLDSLLGNQHDLYTKLVQIGDSHGIMLHELMEMNNI